LKTPDAALVRLNQGLFFCFLATLVWAPLPFASNRPWALALLSMSLSLILAVWLICRSLGLERMPRRVVQRGRWAMAILLSIPAWVLLQVLPLPAEMVGLLSPRAAELHFPAQTMPLSLDVAATRLYFLNSLACAAAFILVLVLVNSERRATTFMWVLVASGLFQAVYGSLMVLTGLEWGFFVEKYTGKSQATGTFVNRNHLAGYLVMILALGTGLLVSQLSSTPVKSWRALVRDSLRVIMSPKIFLRLALAMMVIGLVLTRSRMGNSAFFISLAVAGIVAVLMGRKFSPKLALLLLSLIVVDTWIVGQWFGFDQVVERLEKTTPAEEGRIFVNSDSSAMLKDFPLTGAGGGSFRSVFPYYQGIDSKGYYDHAHNDYFEIAADIGMPALLLLGVLCLIVLVRGLQLQKPGHSKLQRGVGFALVMVLGWLVMHAAVDFNLHIPANSITLSAIFGLAFCRLSTRDGTR
jgi:O-antigen ligase